MADNLKIYCNKCCGSTKHELLRSFERSEPDGETISWQVVQCAGCETVAFYKEHKAENEHGWEVTDFYIYPLRQYRSPKLFVGAPENIERLYRETIDAYNSVSYLFCAGGLRALVEGICAHQGVTDGPKRDYATGTFVMKKDGSGIVRDKNLECKIEGLAEHQILTEKQAMILHEHRYLGNKALHELEVPNKDTLTFALNLIEHIMEDLYNIPSQANGLKKLREGSSQ